MSIFIGVRSVTRGNYGIFALTTLMMLFIYMSLLFLPSLIQGVVNRVNGQLVNTLTSDIVITSGTRAASIADADSLLAKVRDTSGVAHATAVVRVGNQISHEGSTGSYPVAAIDPTSYAEVFTTPTNLLAGRYLTDRDTDAAFLGIGVAGTGQTNVRGYKSSLEDVYTNDQVAITLGNGRTDNFSVVGIYDNQFPLSDDNAYITMSEADQLIPGISNTASAIYVRTDNGADVNRVVGKLAALQSGIKLETSADLGSAVAEQVATFSLVSDILKIVWLVMAAITIFIITYVDLVNKRRQIGIQRAIGISSTSIVLSYVLKALAYALVGVGSGFLIFQYALSPIVQGHPFEFPNGPVTLAATPSEIVSDLVVMVVVASIAALIPALRSVRLRILDAIWGP
ncbi:MAG: ABC transporter permease [Candidatus Dormibacteria bacterium]